MKTKHFILFATRRPISRLRPDNVEIWDNINMDKTRGMVDEIGQACASIFRRPRYGPPLKQPDQGEALDTKADSDNRHRTLVLPTVTRMALGIWPCSRLCDSEATAVRANNPTIFGSTYR